MEGDDKDGTQQTQPKEGKGITVADSLEDGNKASSEGSQGTAGDGSSEPQSESQRSLHWLREYIEKAKREREHAFDIRAACLKHIERPQKNGKSGTIAGIERSKNQYDALKKEKAEEFSEYTAFRYAEKKRAREQGVADKDKTVLNNEDHFQDLRPKKWKTGKNQKKKEPNSYQTEAEEESARSLLEKEVAVVVAQTEKLIKRNAEYTPEFTTIQHIANGEAPHVVASAKSARLTLMDTHPLIAARYVHKEGEWQIATDVSFTIPRIEEGQNVANILQEKVTEGYPLGMYETVALDDGQEDSSSQAGQEDLQDHQMDTERHSPRAFSPLIAKMSEETKLMWRPWRTVTAIPYSVLAGPGIPTELLAVSVAQLLTREILEGDCNLDSKAFAIDLDRYYRSDCFEGELEDWKDEEAGAGSDPVLGTGQGTGQGTSGSIGEYKMDDSITTPLQDAPGEASTEMDVSDQPPS
ncbi:hypothetical protein CBR_g29590 [Chara braunii]|uniref:Uncharacterized protein n=1 Tax=Chara braunii TaxID=69332 RepID=A0A388LB86_CHABU|nr:hypothetical protein CBR_g29590 [Chara braunii]|eukprot:GBG79443.1 hypothetical protein CBR_g29590 [Chara braunii]